MRIKNILEETKDSDNIVVQYRDKAITYKELYASAKRVASLLEDYRNEVILLYLPNSIDYYIAYFAILELDSVITPIHNLSTIHNLNAVRKLTGSRILITSRSQENIARAMNIHTFYIDKNQLECPTPLTKFEDNNIAENTVILLETSGSTSKSKLVMLTDENILTNITSLKKSMGDFEENAKAMIISFLGSSHGNTSEMLFYLFYKIPVVLYDGFVNISKLLRILATNQITRIHLVSPLLILLCKTDRKFIDRFDLSKLCRISFGSCMFPKKLLEKGLERFPHTILVQDYGLTEASPLVTTMTDKDWLCKFGSIGKPLEGIDIRIEYQNAKSNIGELQIKGKGVTSGYYKDTQENAKLFNNGWLRTRDLVNMDSEGYLYFVGRIGRIIMSNGYRINPEEIEGVITSIRGVRGALVYGTEDEIRENCINVDIVLEEDCVISEEDIISHCAQYLPSYKIPQKVYIVKTLEQTATGKIKVTK